MRNRYPRKVMLYNRQKVVQLFGFETQKDEEAITSTGNWIENPAEWNDPDPILTDIQEEEAENIVEPEIEINIHKPETPKEPVLMIKSFVCKTCGFKGKNQQSLSTHQRHAGHGDK